MMGFKDVDDEVRQGRAYQKALDDAKKAEEENRKLIEEVQSAARLADLMGSVSSLLSTNTLSTVSLMLLSACEVN